MVIITFTIIKIHISSGQIMPTIIYILKLKLHNGITMQPTTYNTL